MAEQLPEYRVPLKDMQFLLNEMSQAGAVDGVSNEDLFFILEQAARFAEEALVPINQDGDVNGCEFKNGQVTLPASLREAFKTYAEGGWMGLSMPETYGGQGLPERLSTLVGEILTSANHSFSMTPALTMSAARAIIGHGSDELKETFLDKLLTGTWTGTMCLTEAHCGSDLGLIRTSAEDVSGGVYRIKGNKIFISSGQHDAADNIIHLVLARLKDAPKGIKGLSLFLVPAKLKNKSGVWNKKNEVHCIGIEEKMGMHSNPTCSMSFEGAEGYLIGKPNRGINAMFTMMNEMRLGASLQGIGLSERSFQKSLQYAVERTQMRSLGGVKAPEKEADPIIVHPDVRRMLLTQKVLAEGGRAMAQFCADLLDESHKVDADKERVELLGFLTPIAKGFLTDTGLASADLAIQMYGGHGFIKETGAEQLFRDGRASTLYEGTTGIQALDLLGRKVLASQGKSLLSFTKMLHTLSKKNSFDELADMSAMLGQYAKEWPELAKQVGSKAIGDFEEVGAASFDFLMYSGYVSLAYFWLNMATVSKQLLTGQRHPNGDNYDRDFLEAKVKNARFYFERILPRAVAHRDMMLAGKASMMDITESQLIG